MLCQLSGIMYGSGVKLSSQFEVLKMRGVKKVEALELGAVVDGKVGEEAGRRQSVPPPSCWNHTNSKQWESSGEKSFSS